MAQGLRQLVVEVKVPGLLRVVVQPLVLPLSGTGWQLSSSAAPSPAGGQQRHSKLYKQLDIAFD